MDSNELIQVYEHTREKFQTDFSAANQMGSSELVTYNYQPANVLVLPIDTVSAAETYSRLGLTCILNMASAKRPGGGVVEGKVAQEEALFRCSNLSYLIDKKDYPLKPDQLIYTEAACFIKGFNYEPIHMFYADVITIPAINMNGDESYKNLNPPKDQWEEYTIKKIRMIFHEARRHGMQNLILGAWGCGVFQNDPHYIANRFYAVMQNYLYDFQNIVYAVINDKNAKKNNYEAFKDVFSPDFIM